MRQFFWLIFNRGNACAMIVHTWGDQLLPQLLMEQLDNFVLAIEAHAERIFLRHFFRLELPGFHFFMALYSDILFIDHYCAGGIK